MRTDARRFLVVENPASGSRRAVRLVDRLAARLEPAGHVLDRVRTTGSGHARDLVAEADLEAYDGLVAAGGDGTVHEVLCGLEEWSSRPRARSVPPGGFRGPAAGAPPLSIVAAGAGNALALDLGLGELSATAEALLAAEPRRIDLGRVSVDGRRLPFANVVAWGLAAAVTARGERFRALGKHRYTVAAVLELARSDLAGPDVCLDGRRATPPPLLVLLCNTVRVGSGMRAAPEARIDDGQLDVVRLERVARPRLLGLLPRVFRGTHVGRRGVTVTRSARLTAEFPTEQPVLVDGELLRARRLEVALQPRALAVWAPNPVRPPAEARRASTG